LRSHGRHRLTAAVVRTVRWLRTNVDLLMLVVLAVIVITGWLVAELADAVQEGATQRWDNWVLRQFRRPGDLTTPIGPPWLRDAWRDIAALGSAAVLTLVTWGVAGYLLMRKQYRTLILLLAATISGTILSVLLKDLFARSRPPFASRELYIVTSSFPSGHSMISAVVYLTLGALLARTSDQYRYKIYFISVAAVITGLIGFSRIYLGVHYPTDVLAGWGFGLIWALLFWLIARYLQKRGTIEPPRRPD
jgi:undecaprenyl-diphosphatase